MDLDFSTVTVFPSDVEVFLPWVHWPQILNLYLAYSGPPGFVSYNTLYTNFVLSNYNVFVYARMGGCGVKATVL